MLHCSVMSDTLIEQNPANPKADEWAERIAAQPRSGMSVKQFCKELGLDPNVARPLSRAATMINVRGRGTFSSLRCGTKDHVLLVPQSRQRINSGRSPGRRIASENRGA